MYERWLERVREQVSGERALEVVERITRFHRIQSSPGYDAAADWLAGEVEKAGLEVEVEHAPGDGRTRRLGTVLPEGWACDRAHATLVDGAARERLCDYDARKLSVIQRSAPARGRYPIVALADGTEPGHYDGIDVRGAVVLTSGAVHRVHDLAVVRRGAAGILADGRRLLPPVRGPEDDPEAVNYTSFWWAGDAPRGWGFVVSPTRGAALRARLRDGAALALEVEIESRRFATRIPLLSGRIRGTSAQEVLVVAHLCHPEPGANDNGSGVAAAFEAARTLAALARAGAPPRRSVRFLWMPELTGTCAWFGADPARARRTVAALNLDMVGEDQSRCGSTLLLEHPPCWAGSFAEELLRLVRNAALDRAGAEPAAGREGLTRTNDVPYSGGSDHAVLVDPVVGVPCPMLIQWPDRFYHSSSDTPDKCDPASLALAASLAATYAGFLAHAGDEEQRWLDRAVREGSARRARAALAAPEPAPAAAAEALRARATLASLERLGSPDEAGSTGRSARAEGAAAKAGGVPEERADPVPVRDGAPLDFQRHLIGGFETLSPDERDRFRRDDASTPGGALTLDLAWQACDGRRSVAEIAALVRLECGHEAGESIARFFDWTARLGRSRWKAGERGR